MPQIRHIHVKNFRSIHELLWCPKPGLNCIIGAGDSGKSTILDAIDLTLGARRSYTFTDADFYQLDTTNPIEIYVTLGALSEQLKNIEKYGHFIRGFDPSCNQLYDEPQVGREDVLTLKLTVRNDLDADWTLYSERADDESIERRLSWKHRELVAPARLGAAPVHHLAWGKRSVLNKLSEETINVSSALAQLGRDARETFSTHEVTGIKDVLERVKTVAKQLGITVGELKALVDVNSVSLSHGAISLHNSDDVPLRQLGTGSARLLISGLQKLNSVSSVLLVDEAEYGLEPFRISRLLNELGSKDDHPVHQVFITTHSPYVLRELRADQLHVVKKAETVPFPPPDTDYSHRVLTISGSDDEQSTLRVCADAFFSRAVIVCEGKTEIGIVRGIDLYCQTQGVDSIHAHGTFCADGGGSSLFQRAKIFKSLGYPTAILKDSDKPTEDADNTTEVIALGVRVFEWGNNYAIEDAIFACCPPNVVSNLLNLAIEWKGEDSVNAHIQKFSENQFGLNECLNSFTDSMRLVLAKAAKKGDWYKDIEPSEKLARLILGPNYSDFNQVLTQPINDLFGWARPAGDE